ncbi:MAG: phosphoribosyltransferase [Candidatus Eremiobacteraeota bacterium]|nr:phosphoribosyltransferase [Candidatus Eremiobacteraeota bacterium]MBV8354432.1 phosphoribosyltransferase [Candidatus Eremiobacteraeota bacterium]
MLDGFERPFRDRTDAGRELARRLVQYRRHAGVIILALPRGGVPVGYEVALALEVPLDLVLVRKLGVPGREELAMGAIATGGHIFVDRWLVQRLQITQSELDDVIARERKELERRERAYRDDRPPPEVAGKTVICIDDGLATGASMRTAASALRSGNPAAIVIAVPLASPDVALDLRDVAERVVVARTPERFRALSLWYEDFSQVTDEEVRDLLARAAQRPIQQT